MPQLSLKVPVFRLREKRFFVVVVDAPCFASLPLIKRSNGINNNEVTWLVYTLAWGAKEIRYTLGEPRVAFTL